MSPTTKRDLRLELLMDAGNGAQKAGDILIKAFAKAGRYVFIEPMIPAEISPPKRTKHSMSGVVIRVSSDPISNIGNYSDFMLVEHEILLERRLEDKEYADGCQVLIDHGDQKRSPDTYAQVLESANQLPLSIYDLHMDETSRSHISALGGNGKNMFYLGLLSRLFDVDISVVEALIRDTFKKLSAEKLDQNLDIFRNGVAAGDQYLGNCSFTIPSEPTHGDKVLLDGNTALSLGIIDAGFKMYSGYPITPASSILHSLAAQFHHYGGIVHQAEDEISAIGAVIGSYFGGVPALTATSGPGFSLKQEFLGLSSVSEVPCVLIDVQRGGPSTGLPTKTEQSDLLSAIFGCHGDNAKIVLSVSGVEDCFYVPHLARYLTEKLRIPVLIMSDYQISVSYRVLETLSLNKMTDSVDSISDHIFERFGLSRLSGDLPMVKKNQSTPGKAHDMRRVTGLNTDENGQVMYSSESNTRSHTIRNQKVHCVQDALTPPTFMGPDEGDLLVIGWGSSRGVIEESVQHCQKEGLRVSGLHLRVVYPLPRHLDSYLAKFKKVITAEVSYGDDRKPAPLARLIRSETLIDVAPGLAQSTGRPLKPRHLINKIKEWVS